MYQGTWVRQGTNELVLVCLLPAMTPAPDGLGASLGPLDRGALRDLRLMQGTPESPPPADQRVAIDRLLMVPIRSALDKAPRPAAQARARARKKRVDRERSARACPDQGRRISAPGLWPDGAMSAPVRGRRASALDLRARKHG